MSFSEAGPHTRAAWLGPPVGGQAPDPEGRVPDELRSILERAQSACVCDGGSITLVVGGVPSTIEATAPAAAEADRLQELCAEGPVVDRSLPAAGVVVEDLRTDHRWPRWSPLAADLGWAALLTVPVVAPESVGGALTLYSRRVGAFDHEDLSLTEALAEEVFLVLLRTHHRQLLAADASRDTVRQATDLLQDRHRLDQGAAFDLLRRLALERGKKLGEMSRSLVEEPASPQP